MGLIENMCIVIKNYGYCRSGIFTNIRMGKNLREMGLPKTEIRQIEKIVHFQEVTDLQYKMICMM